jgi:hypothetical protein
MILLLSYESASQQSVFTQFAPIREIHLYANYRYSIPQIVTLVKGPINILGGHLVEMQHGELAIKDIALYNTGRMSRSAYDGEDL